ncbi:MAG: alpha-xylosidase [Prevotella sp.]|nr:alpha-xylosidase [Prevotella sp.]
MKPTNYHLFDFMDFDPALERDEALWKAHAPSKVEERDGDIHITIPFQRQLHQADMAPDTNTPPRPHTLVVRAYGSTILRLFITMVGDEMVESDDMLLPWGTPTPLHLEGDDIVDDNGAIRATIDLRPPVLDHWSDLLPPPQPAPRITFYPDGDKKKGVRLSDDHFSPPRYDALPIGFAETDGSHAERATMSFECEPNECFAGTGERFRKMDLSGQTFMLKNQDGQGVNNRRCYKNIPFYLSNRIYGAWYHTSDYCKLSLADHSTRSVQFLCDRATLDVFLIGGRTPADILKGYRTLTGFPQMPPLWSFGIWMSRMTYFSAKEVEEICRRLRQEHYPCDVIHLDTGWFRTDWLCEWKFNPERFPDPEAFIQRLARQGFKVSLWQLPYVAKGAEQLKEAKEKKYIGPLLKEQAGEGSNFSALDYAGTIDFTYPAATAWYQGLLRKLLDIGVKCIKTDFGENIHLDATYHAMEPERLNNLYALLYQRAAYEVTREATGEGIIWARAAWSGCQRYPLHWGGDSASTWDGMAGSLRGGLHLGLSGFAFWSHDVPGFHSTPDFMNSPLDEQVYVRWTQFGTFTSHFRYHGTCKREPWHYPAIAPIVKSWWKLRYRLIPYIVEQSHKACQGGWPMVQALLMRHPHDRQCWHIDDEYYFGKEFLVCPVMNSEGRRDIYLPEGMWVNFFTGERLDGGRWHYNVACPLERMPVFVRPGAQIPLYPTDVDNTDEMDLASATTWTIGKDYKGYTL